MMVLVAGTVLTAVLERVMVLMPVLVKVVVALPVGAV